jgi:transposase-like protein
VGTRAPDDGAVHPEATTTSVSPTYPDIAGPDTSAAEHPRLTVAAAARRLGVAPATLRTWDRRYGLGPREHRPGQHRRYSGADLARLELMQQALVRGVSPAEAARFALSAATLPTARPAAEPARGPTGEPGPESGPGPDVGPGPGGPATPEAYPGGRVRVGGRMLSMPRAGRRARGLARAALTMDSGTVRELLLDSAEADGLQRTWDEVVRPVLNGIAERWASTGTCVEIEHLVSEAVLAVCAARSLQAPPAHDGRPVVLATAPPERPHLPQAVLAAVLAERGVPCRSLGADLPVDALASAIRRTAPVALVLWSQSRSTASPGVIRGLPVTRPRVRSFVAGPGWTNVGLPAPVTHLESLADATDQLTQAACP